jgi:hypothetical protein
VNLRIFFSHPSLVLYSFATPPIKLKMGQQIGGGLLRANHLDDHYDGPIKNTQHQLDHILTLFSAGVHPCCAFHQPWQPVQLCRSQNHFPEPNGICWIFFIQFYSPGSHTEHLWRCSKDSTTNQNVP